MPFLSILILVTALGVCGWRSGWAGEVHDPAALAQRRAEIERGIQRLGSEDWAVREEAMKKLREYGAEALPQLTSVASGGNPELNWRVKALIREARMATSGRLKELVGGLMQNYAMLEAPQRRITVRKIVERAGAEGIPLLLGLLDLEENVEVLGEIVRQLGWQVADPDALQPLVRFYDRCPERLKGETLWALAAIPGPASLERAREALASANPELVGWGLRAVLRLNDRESLAAIRRLAGKGEGPGEELRIRALEALISLVDTQSGALFKECLRAESLPLKREGLRGIAGIRDRTAARELLELFGSEGEENPNKELREEIVATMGMIGDPTFLPILKGCLVREPPALRITAIDALHRMDARETAAEIAKLLADPDQEVRQAAVNAVAGFGHREAIPAIKALATTDQPQLKWDVARALANLGDPLGLQLILEAARQGGDDWLAQTALLQIGEWHIEEGLELVQERAAANDPNGLQALLSFTKDPRAFRALLKLQYRTFLMAPRRGRIALAVLLEQRGLFEPAIRLVEEAVKESPRDVNAISRMASLYHQAGRYPDAARAFERFEAVSGTNATCLNNSAWFYCTAFSKEWLKPERALEMVRRAVAMEPRSPHFTDTLGWACLVSNRFEDAVRELRKALYLKEAADRPGCAWQRTRVARSLWAAGQRKEAQEEVAQALALAPRDPNVWWEAAGFYAGSGLRDEAMHAIHTAVDRGFIDFRALEMNPEFDGLRSDQGLQYALLRARRAAEKLAQQVEEVEAEVKAERARGTGGGERNEGDGIELLEPDILGE